MIYDLWENRLEEAGEVFELYPNKSLCVLFGVEGHAPGPGLGLDRLQRTELRDGWRRSICESIYYPKFGNCKTVSLPDDLAGELPRFSGFARYERTVEIPFDAKNAFLEISDAYEGVEVFVNGVSLGIQAVPPFRYDLSGYLRGRRCDLRIEAATTLERSMAGDAGNLEPPSGINGKVFLFWI